MRRISLVLCCAEMTILFAVAASKTQNAQTSPTSGQVNQQGVLSISDNVDLVVLDVAVKYPHGGFVTNLGRKAFHVYVDGKSRDITQFAGVDTPLTVGLVLDNSGSMRSERAQLVTAGLAFAKSSNPRDQFFVINFNNFVTSGMPQNKRFTDNLQTLHKALNWGVPEGQTALYDAIADGLKYLEQGDRDKRALIVVSDGGDNVSKTRFPELVRLIEASRATIYTVGLMNPDSDGDLKPAVLRKIANVSGGEYFGANSSEDVIAVLNEISRMIRNRYTLAFIPDTTTDHRVVRSLRVTAEENGAKLLVKTRSRFSVAPTGS
jgi:VWFA-related protein